jgi:hypothetical protein
MPNMGNQMPMPNMGNQMPNNEEQSLNNQLDFSHTISIQNN